MESLQERIIKSSGTFYLQLISIIQSLALGFLLQNAFDLASEKDIATDLSFWLRAMDCFLIIILVWHEYAMGSVAYNWLIDLVDSSVPFCFAITEYMLIYYLDPRETLGTLTQPQAWFLSMVLFMFITTFAYCNQTYKMNKCQPPYEYVGISRMSIRLSAITFVVFLTIFIIWISSLCDLSIMKNWVIPATVLCVIFGHILRIHLGWKKQVQH